MASPQFLVQGIPTTIPADSGVREGEPDGNPEAEVTFRVDWGRRFELVRALRGEIFWAGGSEVVRVGGFPYPDSPNMICLQVPTLQGAGMPRTRPDGWVEYAKADVTARFGVPPYDVYSGQYWSLDLDISGEYVTFPGTSWRFVASGTPPVGAELARPMPQQRISYTAHRLPFLPDVVTNTLTNKLNANPYQVGNVVYPTGSLLFLGARTSASASVDGKEYASAYQLQAREHDWNTALNPATYTWDYVSSDGTMGGVMPFEYADYSIIPV